MAAISGLKPVRSVPNCSNNSRRHSEVHPMPNAPIFDGATPQLGEGSRMQDETAGSASHCSEGALTLIEASRNKLVFPAILQSRRRPMQNASAYSADLTMEGKRRRFAVTADIGPSANSRWAFS